MNLLKLLKLFRPKPKPEPTETTVSEQQVPVPVRLMVGYFRQYGYIPAEVEQFNLRVGAHGGIVLELPIAAKVYQDEARRHEVLEAFSMACPDGAVSVAIFPLLTEPVGNN